MATQHCPICRAAVSPYPRYPRYVCAECAAKAVSVDGRPLAFFNIDMAGGFSARYADSGDEYPKNECFIAGVLCRADEARFGGIVIEAVADSSTSDGGPGATG